MMHSPDMHHPQSQLNSNPNTGLSTTNSETKLKLQYEESLKKEREQSIQLLSKLKAYEKEKVNTEEL